MEMLFYFITIVFIFDSLGKNCTQEEYMDDSYQVHLLWRTKELSRLHSSIYQNPYVPGNTTTISYPFVYPQLRPEGFNNQMISLYFYMQMCLQTGRGLALPLVIESNQWGKFSSMGPKGPFPLLDYFDYEPLMNLIPIYERDYFVHACSNTTLYYITNARDDSDAAIQDEIDLFFTHLQDKNMEKILSLKVINIDWKESLFCKRNSDDECYGNEKFESIILTAFNKYLLKNNQQLINKIPNCIAIQRHLISGVGFGKSEYFNKEKGYIGHSILNKKFANIFSRIQPSKALQCIVHQIIDRIGGPFNGMHIRRGDYITFLEDYIQNEEIRKASRRRRNRNNNNKLLINNKKRKFRPQSILQDDALIIEKIVTDMYLPLYPIFIASDEAIHVKRMILNDSGILNLKVYIIQDFIELFPLWMRDRNDIHLVVEQSLLIHSNIFIGNKLSGVSAYVIRHRLLAGKSSQIF